MAKEWALEIKENKQITKRRIPRLGEWLYDTRNFRAWFTLRGFYAVLGKKDVLVLDERYALPLSPYKDERYKPAEINERIERKKRIEQAFNFREAEAVKRGHMNVVAWTVSIISSLLVFMFIVIVILMVRSSI